MVDNLLGRRQVAAPAAPIRAVHLGLGAFHRSHQAWYIHRMNARTGQPWGIAAFTGTRPGEATKLAPQDGLYTLITRSPDGDRAELVTSIAGVHDGADATAWRRHCASPAVALLTLTVTEAGYRRGPDGHLDTTDPAVRADLRTLAADPTAPLVTAPARLAQGLLARREAGGAPLAIVSCDNLTGNGPATRAVVLDACEAIDPRLAAWAATTVSFPGTMVDRITPRSTADDRTIAAAATGFDDASPVVTEPFSEWIAEDTLRTVVPALADVGVRFVPDVTPYERRKVFVLNGGHSLLAYAGPLRGHDTVADCMGDPTLAGWLEQWWDEAGTELSFAADDLARYRAEIRERYTNPRIRHRLAQIAADGSQKVPVRTAEVIRAHRARGDLPDGAARLVAAWLLHLRGHGAPVQDGAGELVARTLATRGAEAAAVVVGHVVPDLATDQQLIDRIAAHASRMEPTA